MRKLFTIAIVIIFCSNCFGQTDSFNKEEVVETINKKTVLYYNAQTWIAKSFGDYKSVVQFEEKESGKIILKGKVPLDITFHPDFRFIMVIEVKDNKYKYSISDVEIGWGNKGFSESYTYTDNISVKIDTLKNKINKYKGADSSKIEEPELKKLSAISELYQSLEKQQVGITVRIVGLIQKLKLEMTKNNNF
jgi:hypothetical protein